MWFLAYISIFLISLLLSFVLTDVCRYLALRWGFVDRPQKGRFHTRTTPLLGGLGIFLSFSLTIIGGLLAVWKFADILPDKIQAFLPGITLRLPWLAVILAGGLAMAVTGLVDDRINLRPHWKLLIQFIIAFLIARAGIRVKLFVRWEWFSYLVTIFWLLFITNAFNLLDNLDGVSAGVAFISSIMLFLVALMLHQYFIGAILAVFMGSVLGFLYYNFPPAKIFMGDCGSMFIGFIFSIITVLGTYYKPYSPTLFPVAIPLIVLAVPIFDTLSVFVIRLLRKQPLFRGDKNHFAHRLVRLGMREPVAVLFLYLVTLCVGLPSVLLPIMPLAGVLIIFSQAVVVMVIVAILEFFGKRAGE